jgi:hypothetical protein
MEILNNGELRCGRKELKILLGACAKDDSRAAIWGFQVRPRTRDVISTNGAVLLRVHVLGEAGPTAEPDYFVPRDAAERALKALTKDSAVLFAPAGEMLRVTLTCEDGADGSFERRTFPVSGLNYENVLSGEPKHSTGRARLDARYLGALTEMADTWSPDDLNRGVDCLTGDDATWPVRFQIESALSGIEATYVVMPVR